MKFFGKELKFNNNKVYHSGDKPTPNEIGAATGKTASATTAATAQWYRIATSPAGISRCMGNFTIEATVSGKHSATNLIAGVNYGINPTIQQISHSDYSAAGITKARIVYHTSYNNNYAYLEVYQPTATATTINVSAVNLVGWTLVTPSTVGSIPSGYTSKEITLVNNKIVANIQGSVSGSAGSATKATQDSAGQQINTTYIKGLSVSGKTITYTKGDGTTGTITTQDTNTTYSVGTASALGLTKLYTGTGTATDGTMTQSAINTALNGKAATSHTHSGYASASHDHPTPASGSYWNNGYLKVNGDGVMEGGKYLDFHNSHTTTSDYSTRLMCTGDTKNEVQLPSGSGTIGLMRNANGYWGLVAPDGNGDNWIRTTTSGIIPHQSGSASNIGTESWRFTNGYFGYLDASGMIRARDRFEVTNSNGAAQFGVGGSDSFWYNQKANKYIQFKNNGTFCISDSEFYHRGHNIIDVAHRSSGDSGFGDSTRPCGFIGRFPGWNSNCLYINAWSNGGAESASYGIVKIKGSQVQHDGFITIQGTPVSVQSSAPGVGGVWIQI